MEYVKMSMLELQGLYIERFSPLSQKRLLDRDWMIFCLERDDIEKAIHRSTDEAGSAVDEKKQEHQPTVAKKQASA